MKYYLTETAKDTLHLLKGKFGVPQSLAGKKGELKDKAGVNLPSAKDKDSGPERQKVGRKTGTPCRLYKISTTSEGLFNIDNNGLI